MSKTNEELLIINKMYDLVIWSCRHISKFPRDRRYTLGDRMESRLYGILEMLLKAKYSRDRSSILRDTNMELEMLRFQFRIAKDLRCLSVTSYGYGSERVNEVGKLVGSWLKRSVR